MCLLCWRFASEKSKRVVIELAIKFAIKFPIKLAIKLAIKLKREHVAAVIPLRMEVSFNPDSNRVVPDEVVWIGPGRCL